MGSLSRKKITPKNHPDAYLARLASSQGTTIPNTQVPPYMMHPPPGWAWLMFNPPIDHGTPVSLTKKGRDCLAGKVAETSAHHQANHQMKEAMGLLLHTKPHLLSEKKLERLIRRHSMLHGFTTMPLVQVFYMWLRVASRLELVRVREPGELERLIIRYRISISYLEGDEAVLEDATWIARSHILPVSRGATPYEAVMKAVKLIKKKKGKKR